MGARSQKERLDSLNRIVPVSRSARFLRRQSPDGAQPPAPDWATLMALPQWALCPPADQNRIAMIATLLQVRPLIDRELSGQKLSALAAMVGEAAFDAICDVAIGEDWPHSIAADTLPAPTQLLQLGMRLLQSSLPSALQSAEMHESGDYPAAKALADTATQIARDTAVAEPEALDQGEETEIAA
jgi:hypothetical protein